ncbi:MAG: NAD(P)/FAD-dependent oxidoreductase [Actinomycetota bacterium]
MHSSDAAQRSNSYDVVVVGAGFNGLYQLKRLRDLGWSVRLVDAGAGLGGVWHHNRYPGARVDCHIPNYEYSMPEIWQDWTWRERFPGREELVEYFDHVDAVWDLSPDIDLDTLITSARFSDDDRRWVLRTDDGRRYDCRWLIMATGFGSAPFVPELPGLADFDGPCHHTARWPQSGLELDGKRVGIVGTGASGVQVAQEAAAVAAHLTIFQRTPVMALPMVQRSLTVEEQIEAKRNYADVFRRRNAPPGSFHDIHRDPRSALEISDGERQAVFEERWAWGGFAFWIAFADSIGDAEANRHSYEFWKEKVRARIDDPALHESLAPTEPPYPFGTKRPSLEQNFYDIFNQANVDLVDLKHDPLATITASGVRTESGRMVEIDVLILATGFDANTGGYTRMDFRGPDDTTIGDAWAGGVNTHLGTAVPGFPNMLMLYGPQSAASFCNGPVCAELQGEWIVEMLEHLRSTGITRFDSEPAAAESWTRTMATWADRTLFGQADSWYMGANVPGKKRQLLNLPSSDAYLAALEQCAADDYSGFVFS